MNCQQEGMIHVMARHGSGCIRRRGGKSESAWSLDQLRVRNSAVIG